jgi:hypothetical protein
MVNYYEILEIDRSASARDIRAAYKKAIKVAHPDLYDTKRQPVEYERAINKTRQLNHIRDVLLDPARRQDYDAQFRRNAAAGVPGSARPEETEPRHIYGLGNPSEFVGRNRWRSAFRALDVSRAYLVTSAVAATVLVGLVVQSHGLLKMANALRDTMHIDGQRAVTPTACPIGSPHIQVLSITASPDDQYSITGSIVNTTSATIGVSNIGFYLGSHAIGDQPDWVDSLTSIDTTANPDAIPIGQAIGWSEMHRYNATAHPANPASVAIKVSLDFPLTPGTPAVAQWDWPASSYECQPPSSE